MSDYKSCAWYQNGTCIRYDKSGATVSCADCEDYERRVVFKIEYLQERNGEMSVRKSCKTCRYMKHGTCLRKAGWTCNESNGWIAWELSDDAKADVLHDAEPEHDIPKMRYMKMDKDIARLFGQKIGIVLSAINEESSSKNDRDASEALLNLIKAAILITKFDDIEVTEDDKR